METKFYETEEGHKILDETYWPEQLKEYRELENKYLLENIEDKDSLLDLGCGTGKHLILLKDKIKNLRGIDHSKTIIEKAKINGENITIINSDIKDFETEMKFDYVICMFNTFGNLDQETQITLLKKAEYFLKKDGKIILSVYSENAKEDQIQFYKNIGLTIKGLDDNFIYTKEGFASERFSEEKFKKITENVLGLKIIKFIHLNKISLVVEMKKIL